MNDDLRNTIQCELAGILDGHIRLQFAEHYQDILERFVDHMIRAYWACDNLNLNVDKDETTSMVAGFTLAAVQNHILSMKLLISGYFVAAENAQRYSLESIATALLASHDPELRIKIRAGQYKSNKSVRDLRRQASKLGLDQEFPGFLDGLEKSCKFYHELSHPSLLSLSSSLVPLNSDQRIFLVGCHFDPEKKMAYDSEIYSREKLATLLPGIIDFIRKIYAP